MGVSLVASYSFQFPFLIVIVLLVVIVLCNALKNYFFFLINFGCEICSFTSTHTYTQSHIFCWISLVPCCRTVLYSSFLWKKLFSITYACVHMWSERTITYCFMILEENLIILLLYNMFITLICFKWSIFNQYLFKAEGYSSSSISNCAKRYDPISPVNTTCWEREKESVLLTHFTVQYQKFLIFFISVEKFSTLVLYLVVFHFKNTTVPRNTFSTFYYYIFYGLRLSTYAKNERTFHWLLAKRGFYFLNQMFLFCIRETCMRR